MDPQELLDALVQESDESTGRPSLTLRDVLQIASEQGALWVHENNEAALELIAQRIIDATKE